jgi:hypothetical protein
MLTKHVFWGKYFGKSVFGHFFCPFLIFPKYFPSKKTRVSSTARREEKSSKNTEPPYIM